jgi:hypothetical protein
MMVSVGRKQGQQTRLSRAGDGGQTVVDRPPSKQPNDDNDNQT